MNVTHKTLGLSIIALAAALFASASVADNRPPRPMEDRMGLMSADADKDGKISKAEFEAWRAARVTLGDTDKDGKLSVDELVAMRMAEAQVRAKAMAERMVEMQDADGDGKLSAEELVAMPTPGFDKLDANGDGTIDKAELQAFRGEHGGPGKHGRRGHHGMAPDMAPEQDPAAN